MIYHSLLGQIAKDLQSLAQGVTQAEIESSHQISLPIVNVRGSYSQAALDGLWVKQNPIFGRKGAL